MSNSRDANRGHLFVISSPSGGGKSSIIRKILGKCSALKYSISATTRARHEGEVEGKDYYFVSREEFQRMIEADELIEYEKVHDHYYGTPKQPLEESLNKGESVILDIDVKGGQQIKKLYPEAALIFILPPSLEALKQRIQDRGRENPAEIELRMKRIEMEIEAGKNYDFTVVNDNLEEAVKETVGIIDKTINKP